MQPVLMLVVCTVTSGGGEADWRSKGGEGQREGGWDDGQMLRSCTWGSCLARFPADW